MFAQIRAGLAQSTEIDDSFDSGVLCGTGECQSQLMILLGVVRSRRHHGMDEVIRCLASFQLAGQGRFVGQVCQSDLNVWISSPRAILQFGWCPHQTPDCIAVLVQTRGKTATNVPSYAGYRYAFRDRHITPSHPKVLRWPSAVPNCRPTCPSQQADGIVLSKDIGSGAVITARTDKGTYGLPSAGGRRTRVKSVKSLWRSETGRNPMKVGRFWMRAPERPPLPQKRPTPEITLHKMAHVRQAY